jgi:AraC-like DNA-binding protein
MKSAFLRLCVSVSILIMHTDLLRAQETGSLLMRIEAMLRADPGMADSVRQAYDELIISGRDDPDDSLSAQASRLLAEAYGRIGLTDVEVFFEAYAGSTAWGEAHPSFKFERDFRRGYIRERQQRFPGASGRYTDALGTANRAGDSARIVLASTGLVRVAMRLGDLTTASASISQILPVATRLGNQRVLAEVRQAAGALALATGVWQDAVDALSEAVKFHRSMLDTVACIDDHLLLAKALMKLSRPEDALQSLTQAFDLSAHSISSRVRVLIDLAEFHKLSGNSQYSDRHLQLADTLSFNAYPEWWIDELFPVLSDRLVSGGASAAREALLRRYVMARDVVKLKRDEVNLIEGKIISEWERLDTSDVAVRDIRRDRNRIMGVMMAFLISALFAVIIIFRQHQRMRAQLRTLFRKNLEEMQQAAEVSVAQRILESEPPANLEEATVQARYQAILQLMERDKPWLDAGFSLQDLSTRLATNQKYISQAINMFSDTGFSGLMNRYRVNEARRLILEGKPDTSLNDIALQAGFTNRVSFYRQFKEITGISPSEFVKLAR